MSAPRDGDPALSAAGEARASDEVERDSGPSGGDTAPGPGAAGVAGAPGGPEAVALEGGSAEEDIGPAEEEGEGEEGLDVAVEAHQFPMAGFRLMFLDLVHSLLHRIYYNDHILIRPHGGRVMVHPRPRSPGSMALELQGPERPEEGPAEAEATEEAEEEASAWEAAQEELAEEAQDTASVWQLAMEAPAPDGERRVKGQKRSPHHRWRPLPPTVSGRRSLWELKATGAQGEPSPLRAFPCP
ncbi:cancer/testis antigen 47A-like [Phacochoerus africanus]|uniref:cancer/testis antigen 47A-like n=1 Tax=Phacochoerus africanus TaxID=41426 RepID=UPI001FD96539|nr:cancer/testis antigen 47A-like [Phacochoerus africanus]